MELLGICQIYKEDRTKKKKLEHVLKFAAAICTPYCALCVVCLQFKRCRPLYLTIWDKSPANCDERFVTSNFQTCSEIYVKHLV